MILPIVLATFVSWGGPSVEGPMRPSSATPEAAPMVGIIGLGGRLSWEAEPRDEPSVHLDGQLVLRPIPRVFATGAWGRSERSVGGDSTLGNTVVRNRWELGAALVVVQAVGSGYIPVVWRSTHETDDRQGDASWSSWGFGVGGLFPVSHPVWIRMEGLWMMEDEHETPVVGRAYQTERSGMELGVGFLVFLR
jgi:hypothetical protein